MQNLFLLFAALRKYHDPSDQSRSLIISPVPQHNLDSLQKVIRRRNRETTRWPIPRTSSWCRERRQRRQRQTTKTLEILKIKPKRYQDSVLWAWLEIVFTPLGPWSNSVLHMSRTKGEQRVFSFAFDSAHVKYGVRPGPLIN